MSRHINLGQMPGVLPMHMAHEAPRLKERSVLARLAFCALGIACCGAVIVAAITAMQVWMPDTTPPPQPAQLHHNSGPTTFVSVHGAEPHHRKAPIQRSVIQRLAMLKRAPGGKGVDMHWVGQMFPRWIAEEVGTSGEQKFDVQATLSDLVLAIAYLAQAEVEE